MAEPTQVVQNQIGFSPVIEPYAQTLMGAASDAVFGTPGHNDENGNWVDGTTGIPYNSYADWASREGLSGDQVAGFSGLQQQAFGNAANLGIDPRSLTAATGLESLAQRMGNMQYQGDRYNNQFDSNGDFNYNAQNTNAASAGVAPTMQAASAGRAENVTAAQSGAAPLTQAERLGAAPQMQAARGNFNPNSLQQYQMSGPQQVRSQNFGQTQAEQYMSPYVQSVINKQQRDAERQANIATTQRNAAATGAGAFGGSRQAIMDAEAARELALQKGDIEATGLQNAFTQAQQQFNADQGRGLTAQQSNQNAGLTTGTQNLNANLATQQLGANLGQQMALANLGNQQQANQTNQATQAQFALANAGYGNQANLANQQMQGQFGLANLSNQQQANMANQAAQNQFSLANAGFQQQANQANQALQGQYGLSNAGWEQQANLANQAAGNQANQFNAGQNLNAANSAAQFGQAANQLNTNQQQFGANYGLQALQGGLGAYGALGSLGQNIYGQTTGNINLMNALGGQQQQQAQNLINSNIRDYQNEMNYPYRQMSFMSDILRGAPLSQTGSTAYTAGPSTLQTVAGLGSLAQGLSRKTGGMIRNRPSNAGLNVLALSQM
jgi:hypothetical protein